MAVSVVEVGTFGNFATAATSNAGASIATAPAAGEKVYLVVIINPTTANTAPPSALSVSGLGATWTQLNRQAIAQASGVTSTVMELWVGNGGNASGAITVNWTGSAIGSIRPFRVSGTTDAVAAQITNNTAAISSLTGPTVNALAGQLVLFGMWTGYSNASQGHYPSTPTVPSTGYVNQTLYSTGAIPNRNTTYRIPTETSVTAHRVDLDNGGFSGAGGMITGWVIGGYDAEVLADAPLVYLKLDETSGTTATDSSGGAKNGTYSGTVSYAQPKLFPDAGTSIGFNGSNTLVSVPNTGLTTAGNAPFTAEAWVNTNTSTGTKTILARRQAGGTEEWILRLESLTVHFWTFDPTFAFTDLAGPTLGQGGNYHIVGTYDGSIKRIYVNGTLAATSSATGVKGTNAVLSVGGNGSGGPAEFFSGQIDNAAYYETALSAARVGVHYTAANLPQGVQVETAYAEALVTMPSNAQVEAAYGEALVRMPSNAQVEAAYAEVLVPKDAYFYYVRTDGATGYWRLNEPSGSVASDSSGNGWTMNLSGTYTRAAPGLLGFSFDAATSFAGGKGATAASMPTTLRTYEAIIRPTSFGSGSGVLIMERYGTGNNAKIQIYLTPAGVLTVWMQNDSAVGSSHSGPTLALNTGYHIAVTSDATALKMYVNGAQVYSATPGEIMGNPVGSAFASAYPLTIGSTEGGTFPFQGTLDEVAVYPTALSASQIAAHYAAARIFASYYDAVLFDGPQFYYRFAETSGTSFADSSGNSRTGTSTGTVTPNTVNSYGGLTPALGFGGGYVANSWVPGSMIAVTVEALVKTTQTTGGAIASARISSNTAGFTLFMGNTPAGFGVAGEVSFGFDGNLGGGIYLGVSTTTFRLNDGNWHHVVGVWQGTPGVTLTGSQFLIYIDGVLAALTNRNIAGSPVAPVTVADAYRIGSAPQWSSTFTGTLDEVAVYSKVLGPESIITHYNLLGAAAPVFTSMQVETVAAEVLVAPDPAAQVESLGAEVLVAPSPPAFIETVFAEVLRRTSAGSNLYDSDGVEREVYQWDGSILNPVVFSS